MCCGLFTEFDVSAIEDEDMRAMVEEGTKEYISETKGACVPEGETTYESPDAEGVVGTYACGATSLAASVTMAAIATISYLQ